jgi:hypothetical protein
MASDMVFDVVAAKRVVWYWKRNCRRTGEKAGGERERQSEAVGNSYRLYPFAVSDVRSAHLSSPHFTLSRNHRSRPDVYLVCPKVRCSVYCHDRLFVQQSVAAMSYVHEPSAEYAEPTE